MIINPFDPLGFSIISQKYTRKHPIIEDIHIFLLKLYLKLKKRIKKPIYRLTGIKTKNEIIIFDAM